MTYGDARGDRAATRVVVVGLGAFGTAHLEAWRRRGDASVVAAVDPRPDRAQAAGIPALGNVDELLAAVAAGTLEVDVASVASPNASHARIGVSLMEAGIDVIVEKPLAASADDARRLAATAAATGRVCLPGHVLRFSRGHRELRSVVESGDLGDVLAVSSSRDRSADTSLRFPDENPIVLTGVHDVDLALWLTGSPVTAVRAQQRPDGAGEPTMPRLVWAMLDHESGALSTVQATYLLPLESPRATADRVAVHGTRGSAYLDSQSGLLVVHAPDGVRTIAAPPDLDQALRAELAHLLDCVRERTQSAVVPLADAVNAVEAVSAIAESAHHGGTTIRLRPEEPHQPQEP